MKPVQVAPMTNPTLWEDDQGEKVPATLGIRARRALVVCDGPSAHGLHRYVWSGLPLLRGSDIVFVTVGDGARHCKCDIVIGMDHPANYPVPIYEHQVRLYSERFKNLSLTRGGLFVRNTLDFDNIGLPTSQPILEQCAREMGGYLWHKHSLITALHLLIVAGVREINLVGVEAKPDGIVDRYSDAFDGVQKLVAGLKGEVDIACCSPLSPMNQFLPYRSLFELLQMPSHLPPVHPWPDGMQPFGVVTGADSAQEFLLPWWLANVRRYNPDAPVAVADFGLTDEMRQRLIHQRCVVYPVRGDVVNPWFFKPSAIAAAPFDTVLWLDADIEVRGSLACLRDLGDTRIAIVRDQLYPSQMSSGTVVVHSKDPLVTLWHEAIRHDQSTHDQAVLGEVLRYLELRPVELPECWNWTVYDEVGRTYESVPSDAICVHHGGTAGKERLRDIINAGREIA